MGTLFLNEANLIAVVEQLTVRASWAIAMTSIGASEALAYQWLDKSRKAEKANDSSSPFWLTWRDEQNFWHRHCARARRDNLLSLSAMVADRLKHGHEAICYSPQDGRPLPALDPEFLGVSDDEMRAQMLDPVRDRWLWRCDEQGNRIEPVWQTRTTDMPASLAAVALRGLLPKTFGEKAVIEHNLNASVTHIIEPAKFLPRAERLAIEAKERGDVVDGEFTEVAPVVERPDIAALRAQWEARQANPNKVTQPRGIVRDAVGQPIGTKPPADPADDVRIDKPQVPLSQHNRAYTNPTPEPQPPRPTNYPRHSDPNRPGAIASRIIK